MKSNGTVIEGTPIAVDFWRPQDAPHVQLFFLTHLHADHTCGLTSSWKFPIYTSCINAKLFPMFVKADPSLLRPLSTSVSHIIPLESNDGGSVTVTVIPANHCPGAVMFFFEGIFGNILYCGDCRYTPEMLTNPVLKKVVQNQELDIVYLDNTFCSPECTFPPRKEAAEEILKIIRSHPDHGILITLGRIGKENLIVKIAFDVKEPICISQQRLSILNVLEVPDCFTLNSQASRIHILDKRLIPKQELSSLNEKKPTITIMPTALYYGWTNGPYTASKNVFVVPYSDHSSFPELREFVSHLRPGKIRPIVTQFSSAGWWAERQEILETRVDMSVFDEFLRAGCDKVPDVTLGKHNPNSGQSEKRMCVAVSNRKFNKKHNVHKKRISKGIQFVEDLSEPNCTNPHYVTLNNCVPSVLTSTCFEKETLDEITVKRLQAKTKDVSVDDRVCKVKDMNCSLVKALHISQTCLMATGVLCTVLSDNQRIKIEQNVNSMVEELENLLKSCL